MFAAAVPHSSSLRSLQLSALPCPARLREDRRVPPSAAELQLTFAPVVKRVAPAVVNVYAAAGRADRNPFFNDPLFRQFFGAVPRERVQRSLGSGVIVDPAGLVVTNNHVVEGATEVKVALSDKREFNAKIVLTDAHTDLAVLRIKGAKERLSRCSISPIPTRSQVGDWCWRSAIRSASARP